MYKPEQTQSRRKFIETIALAGAAIPLRNLYNEGTLFPSSSRPIHVFSKPLQWFGYEALAELLSEAGAEGIDLSVRPGGHVLPEKVETDLPKAVEAARKKGLKVEMIVTGIVNTEDRYTEPVIRTASSLGIKYYRLGYINYDDSSGITESINRIRTDFERLSVLNRKYNIHGAYQNHTGVRLGAQVWDLFEILKDLDPACIGCQYDVRHAMVEGANSWVNNFRLIYPWIKCTDIKDFKWTQTNGKWAPESVPIGDGIVNFDTYFKMVQKFNVPGPISIHLEYPPFERFTKELPEAEKRALFLTTMKKDIESVKSYLTKYQL